jgi:hypothetical protein
MASSPICLTNSRNTGHNCEAGTMTGDATAIEDRSTGVRYRFDSVTGRMNRRGTFRTFRNDGNGMRIGVSIGRCVRTELGMHASRQAAFSEGGSSTRCKETDQLVHHWCTNSLSGSPQSFPSSKFEIVDPLERRHPPPPASTPPSRRTPAEKCSCRSEV